MTSALPTGLTDCLLWSDELGMGYHPRPAMDYTGPYFEKYQALDGTDMGAALTAARVAFVRTHYQGQVVDIGIGGGRFVVEYGALGYDVNQQAIDWLGDRYCDPYQETVEAITCWDSLEHIRDPEALLRQVTGCVFVSMPIYQSQSDCLTSKHFKPGEHIWYWTERGLIDWCKRQGFRLMGSSRFESDIGREGIISFAFERSSEVEQW